MHIQGQETETHIPKSKTTFFNWLDQRVPELILGMSIILSSAKILSRKNKSCDFSFENGTFIAKTAGFHNLLASFCCSFL